MNFQDIILKLHEYWADQGCIIQQPYDVEVGAGTFNPATFLRVLGPEPWRVAYVEPSRRPTDGRYGENPWRMGHYYQYQVILKPVPTDIQDIYLKSLEKLGIDLLKHDVRFVEDDWESPTLGASGLGWEVWLDSSEITQYTYFQQMGSLDLDPISVEITYGLERIAVNSQDVDSIFNIEWLNGISYGHIHHQSEVEFSKYYLDTANIDMLFNLFDVYEHEAYACLSKGLVLPVVDYVLKCSHTFNILDARGSISVTERASYIARVRNMARRCAQGYCKQREEMGYPLLNKVQETNLNIPNISYAKPKAQKLNFLLEIGTEEIPASYIEPALDQLKNLLAKLFDENRIEYGEINVIGTPRRLILSAENVSTQQPDRTVEVIGPPKKTAYDESGKLTKSAEGFARKYGVSTDEIKIKNTDRGEYISLSYQEKGSLTIEILSENLPKLISSIAFPKSMHFSSFEDSKLQFARPIRWILALFGNEIVKFKLGRIESDRFTFGHRFLSKEPIEIKSPLISDIKATLRQHGVIADHNERRELIKKQITKILESEGSPIYIDEELLNTVTFLVEMPKPVVGEFNSSYLSLPVEVLETAMKKHQKYFSIHEAVGLDNNNIKLLPKFITITNGVGEDDVIRHGNERVLGARLADAEFFFIEDQKTKLSDKVDRLKNVVFQEELGSLYDKSCRLKKIADFLCHEINTEQSVCENAIRAAELCKVDLITQMVMEFPTLQGIMGGYYASNSGENEEVSIAIRSHYYPVSVNSPLPENLVGCIVSISDKLDTIIGYFGIGNIPSGSQDPFALRRQATGIIRILLEKGINLSLERTVKHVISLYTNQKANINIEGLADNVLDFLKSRISSILSENGFTYDVIDSVLSIDSIDPLNIMKRANALKEFKNRNDFNRIYPALNRVIRILPDKRLIRGDKKFEVKEKLFQDQVEQNLYSSILSIEKDVMLSAEQGSYDIILNKLSTLCDSIDAFFDKVMVMAEQDDLRNNRLSLLYRLANMLFLVADFSKLIV